MGPGTEDRHRKPPSDTNPSSGETLVSESAPNGELSFNALDNDGVSDPGAAEGRRAAHEQASGEDAELSLDALADMEETRPATEAQQRALEREISGAEAELSFALISDLVEPSALGPGPDASLSGAPGKPIGPDTAQVGAELRFEEFLTLASSNSESGRESPSAETASPTFTPETFPARPVGVGSRRRGSDPAPGGQDAEKKMPRDPRPRRRPAAAAVSQPGPSKAPHTDEPTVPDGARSNSISWRAVAAMVAAAAGVLWFLFLR